MLDSQLASLATVRFTLLDRMSSVVNYAEEFSTIEAAMREAELRMFDSFAVRDLMAELDKD